MTASPNAALASLEQALEQIKVANFYLRTPSIRVAEGFMIVETTAADPKIGPPIIYGNSQVVMMSRAKPETGLRGMGAGRDGCQRGGCGEDHGLHR